MHDKSTRPFIRSGFCALAVLAFAATAAPLAGDPPSPDELAAMTESFVLRPGVVVDPARSAFYLMEPGGIAARDLASGGLLWTSDAAAVPLGLHGGSLIALAEPTRPATAEVIFLALADGGPETAIQVGLPEGVAALVDEQPRRWFRASMAISGSEALLYWSYSSQELRGTPAAGDPAATPAVSDPAAASSPAAAVPERGRQAVLEGVVRLDPLKRSIMAPGAAAPPPPPLPIPDLSAAEALPGISGRQFRAADERHVLASQRIADTRTWARYRWTIFDHATGVRLGEIDQPRSMAAFFVSGSALIYESPPYLRRLESGDLEAQELRLRAVDLASGRELWSVALRDTVYRGPLPP